MFLKLEKELMGISAKNADAELDDRAHDELTQNSERKQDEA